MAQSSGTNAALLTVQFANGRLLNVTKTPFQTALRDLQADFSNRPMMIGLLAFGLIIGISGPFGTFDVLPAVPRLMYWITVVVLSFATGAFVSSFVHTILDRRLNWRACVVSALAVAVAVNTVLCALNFVALRFWFETWRGFFVQLGNVALISGVIEFGIFALRAGIPAEVQAEARVPLMERLPFEKRGEIVALSAEDHYVRVTTTKGTELILMRLSDAMREVGNTAGLKVHRSHWISIGQVKKVARKGARAEVVLSDGITRPISRSYMDAARTAGLFPTKRAG